MAEPRNWADMSVVQFDEARVPRGQRRIARTAPGTLFPDLLPDPLPPKPADLPPECDGQGDLLGGDL